MGEPTVRRRCSTVPATDSRPLGDNSANKHFAPRIAHDSNQGTQTSAKVPPPATDHASAFVRFVSWFIRPLEDLLPDWKHDMLGTGDRGDGINGRHRRGSPVGGPKRGASMNRPPRITRISRMGRSSAELRSDPRPSAISAVALSGSWFQRVIRESSPLHPVPRVDPVEPRSTGILSGIRPEVPSCASIDGR